MRVKSSTTALERDRTAPIDSTDRAYNRDFQEKPISSSRLKGGLTAHARELVFAGQMVPGLRNR